MLKTVNSGSTWTPVGGGRIGTGDVYAVEALDAATALVTTTPTTTTYLFRTTNGGTTWDTVYQQAGGFLDAIRMFDPANGIALGDPVGGRWTIVKTTNGGATWTRDTVNAPLQVGSEAGTNNGFWALNPSTLWFPANSTPPKVYRTTNGGATWSSPALPFSASFTSGSAFNGTAIGVVGGSNGAAARTTDGGATWSAVTIGSGTGGIFGVAAPRPDFFASKGAEVYLSTDRGLTWSSSLTGTLGSFTHISFATSGGTTRAWGVSVTGGIAAFYNSHHKSARHLLEVELIK